MSALARIEQSARFDGDEFFERLNLVFNAERVWTFLKQNRLEGVFLPNEQILAHLGLDAAATFHPQIGSRIKKAMQTLGWESTSRRVMGVYDARLLDGCLANWRSRSWLRALGERQRVGPAQHDPGPLRDQVGRRQRNTETLRAAFLVLSI